MEYHKKLFNHGVIVLTALIQVLVYCPAQAQNTAAAVSKAKVVKPQIILIARPIDVAYEKDTKNKWLIALAQTYTQVRIEGREEFTTVPFESLVGHIPAYNKINQTISDLEYMSLAKKIGASYILYQKFEATENNGIEVNYYMELHQAPSDNVVTSAEKNFPIDALGQELDDCFFKMFKDIKLPQTQKASDFYKVSLVGINGKKLRSLGDLLGEDFYKEPREYKKAAGRYADFARQNSDVPLAFWLAGTMYASAKSAKESADNLKAFLNVVPTFPPVYSVLMKSLRQLDQNADAVAVADRGRKAGIQTEAMLVEELLADIALKNRDNAYAVALKLLEVNKAEPNALLFVAQWRNRETRFQEALDIAEQLLKAVPNSGPGLLEKGRALKSLKKPDAALSALTQAALLLSKDPEPYLLLGDIYFGQKEYAKAAASMESALNLKSDDLDLALKTAGAYELAGSNKSALNIVLKMEPKYGSDKRLAARIGLLQYSQNDTAGARQHLEKCLATLVEDGRVFMAMGEIYSARNDYLKAIRMFEQAMGVMPDKNVCKMSLARVYLKKGEPENAITQLDQIAAENKAFPEVYRYLGDAYRDAGNAAKSIEYYKRARASKPDDAAVQDQIAKLSYASGNLADSKQENLNLIKVTPGNAEAHYRLATIALKEKDAAAAQAYLKKAASLGEADQETYYQIATGYTAIGNFVLAEENFRKCLSKNPSRAEAWVGLSETQVKAGKDSAAAETYLKVAEFGLSEHVEYPYMAGKLFEKTKSFARAKKAYNLYLGKPGANNSDASVRLARLEFADKNYQAILAVLGNRDLQKSLSDADNMILAESYYNTGDFKNAFPLLERAIKSKTEFPRCIELAAIAATKNGDISKAVSLYQSYLSLPPSKNHSEFSFRIAFLYEKANDSVSAQKWYDNNTKNYPQDMRNYERLAALCTAAGNWACAQKTLEAGLGLPEAKPALRKQLAETYEKQSIRDKAIDQYRQYLQQQPADSLAWLALGSLYYAQEAFSEAIEPLKKAVAAMPAHFKAAVLLGISYLKLGKYAEAAGAFLKARSINSKDMSVISSLAQCYRKLNDSAKLITILREWQFLDPENKDVETELGKTLLAANNTGEALKILESVSKKNPSDIELHKILADTYEKTGNEKERLAHINTALEYATTDGDLYYKLAQFYLARNKRPQAMDNLKKALDYNPKLNQARFEYARMLRENGNTLGAFEELDKSVAQDPYNARILVMYSKVAYQMDKPDSAMSAVARALKIDSLNAEALEWIGFLYSLDHKADQAKAYLYKAISRNANCAMCYEYLGDLAAYQADYLQAAQNFEKSLGQRNYSEEVSIKLAGAVVLSGLPEKAAVLFEKILSINKKNDEAAYWLAHVYIALGRLGEAEDLPKKLGFTQKTGWLHLAQGEIYEAQGNYDAALISFSVASRLMPNEPLALAATGRMYLAKGKFDDAVMDFGKALGEDPHNPTRLIELGRAYEGLTDYTSALQMYTEVMHTNPQFLEAFSRAGGALSKMGDHAKAISILEAGLAKSPEDAQLNLSIGHEYRANGQYDKAIKSYEKAAKKGGAFIEAYRHIGALCQENLKDNKKAKSWYEKYLKAGGQNEKVKKLISQL